MKKWIAIVFLPLMAMGCSSLDVTSAPTETINHRLDDLIIQREKPSNLQLPNGRRIVHLGDSEDKANTAFPKPGRGFPLSELPTGVPSTFKAKGWESPTEGFGMILSDGQLELVMHQYESLPDEEATRLIEQVKSVNSEVVITKESRDKYDIWIANDGRDRLVISRTPVAKNSFQVSMTLGHNLLMDHLGLGALNVVPTRIDTNTSPEINRTSPLEPGPQEVKPSDTTSGASPLGETKSAP